MSGERSLPASAKKRRKVRREGRGFKAQIMAQALGMAGFLLILSMISGGILDKTRLLLQYALSMQGSSDMVIRTFLSGVLLPSFSILILIGVLSVGTQLWQHGPVFNLSLALPKLSRFGGFSAKRFQTIGRELFRVLVYSTTFLLFLTGFLYWFIKRSMTFSGLTGWGDILLQGVSALVAIFLVIALLDLFLRKREFEKEIGMSFDEAKQEHKEEEGDQLIRAVRKAYHRAILMQHLKERVKSSKCIVVGHSGGH